MKTTIMEKLKTELYAVKAIIEKHGVFDIWYINRDMETDFLNGFEYQVILTNGTNFRICIGTTFFPECNFDDIVYIKKRRGISVDDNVTPLICDTENGDIYTDDYFYTNDDAMIKFGASFNNEIYTDCDD